MHRVMIGLLGLLLLSGCSEAAHELGPQDDKSDAVGTAGMLWPGGDVYLIVDTGFWDFDVAWALENAAEELAENTAVRLHFIESEEEAPDGFYINFEGRIGWFLGGAAPLGVQEGADASAGSQSVRHELGHILGLHHTQARQDRDEHVTVHWDYIPGKYWKNFHKWGLLLGPYDTDSIMHYESQALGEYACASISIGVTSSDDCITGGAQWKDESTTEYTDWNYSTLAALYCQPRLCGDNCADAERCDTPAVQRHLKRLADWESSEAGIDLADRYPEYVR